MINQHDRGILRELAKRVAEIAALPEVAARPALWKTAQQPAPAAPAHPGVSGRIMERAVAARGLRLRG